MMIRPVGQNQTMAFGACPPEKCAAYHGVEQKLLGLGEDALKTRKQLDNLIQEDNKDCKACGVTLNVISECVDKIPETYKEMINKGWGQLA